MTSAVAAILSWSRRHRTRRCRVDASCSCSASLVGIRRLSVRHRRAQPAAARRPGDPRVPVLPRELRQPRPALHRLQRACRPVDRRLRRARSTPGSTRCDKRRKSRASTAARWTRPATSAGWPTASCCCFATMPSTKALNAFQRRRHAAGGRRTPRTADRAVAGNRAARAAGSARTLRSDAGTARRLARPASTSAITEGGYVTKDGRRRLVIAQPARPPYDADFSRALFARLEHIRASVACTAGRTRTRPTTSVPPLADRVRRRTSHRGRNRSARPAREHLEHRRLAGVDSAAAVHRLPQPVARRRRIAAVRHVARARARRARFRRRDALGRRDGVCRDALRARRRRRRAALRRLHAGARSGSRYRVRPSTV